MLQAAIRGRLARKNLGIRKNAKDAVDLEALKRIEALPAAYTEARMDLPSDELKQPCDEGLMHDPVASAEDEEEGGETFPRGPLLRDAADLDSSGNNVSGLDLDKMGLPAAVDVGGEEGNSSDGLGPWVEEKRSVKRGEHPGAFGASGLKMEGNVSIDDADDDDDDVDDRDDDDEAGIKHGSDRGDLEGNEGKKRVKERKEEVVDLEAEFDEDSDDEEEEARVYDDINGGSGAKANDVETKSEATLDTSSAAHGSKQQELQENEIKDMETIIHSTVSVNEEVEPQKREKPLRFLPKEQPLPVQPTSGRAKRDAQHEESAVIPSQQDYLSRCGKIDTPRSLYALFRLIHQDSRPYRKSVVSDISPTFGQRKSPLKPSLTGSNRQLIFGPSLNDNSGFNISSGSSESAVSSKPTPLNEVSSSAQMEQNLSSMRRRAEKVYAGERRRVDYVQRSQLDTSVAKEVASTLLTARQQNKLMLTTPAESIGYWIYTEGWGALLAAFEVDKHDALTQPADSMFMEELRRQIRSKGSVNGELVRQYLNCVLRGLAPSKQLSNKVRAIPAQEEIPPSFAWSFGRAVLAFRRVFMSYYCPGLFRQVESDIELHCKLVKDAINDLNAFQAQLVSSLLWHYPHLIASNVRDQSGTFGKVVAEAFQHRDSRQGSSFLSVSEAKDVVQACVEDAVVNPLMDNLYLFFFPLCHNEDQTILAFCESRGEMSDAGEIFAQFQDSTWNKVLSAATASIEQGFQQRTFSSKLRSMTEALQILLLHERARANEEVLVNAFL